MVVSGDDSYFFRAGMVLVMSCCCDAENCVLCADDFDRGDGTDIDTGSACGWTEQSGAWEILSNRLRSTSTGIATCDTTQPGTQANYILVKVRSDTAGDEAKTVFNFVDTNNYDYVGVIFSSTVGQLRIRSVSGGVDSSVKQTSADLNISLNTNHELIVCVGSGDVRAKLTAAVVTRIDTTSLGGVNNSSVGVASVTSSGNIEFDDWSYEKNGSILTGCNTCELEPEDNCDSCLSGESTTKYQVDISGIKNSPHCPKCDARWNGTVVFDWSSSVGDCSAFKDFPITLGTTCDPAAVGDTLILRMNIFSGAPTDTVQVTLSYFVGGARKHVVKWELTTAGGVDCMNLDQEPMPLVSDVDGASGCDVSESEVRITTLATP